MELLKAIVISFLQVSSAEGADCWVSAPHTTEAGIHAHVTCERNGYEWDETFITHRDGDAVFILMANGRMS